MCDRAFAFLLFTVCYLTINKNNPKEGGFKLINEIRIEWRGQKLGYLPRAENRAVATAMDGGEAVDARIAKLRQHRNPWQRVLIEVFVVL